MKQYVFELEKVGRLDAIDAKWRDCGLRRDRMARCLGVKKGARVCADEALLSSLKAHRSVLYVTAAQLEHYGVQGGASKDVIGAWLMRMVTRSSLRSLMSAMQAR